MRRSIVYLILGIFALIYIGLSLGLPPDPASLTRYHITALQAHLLVLTIVIPVIAIWCAAFYGYYALKRYSALVKKSDEGKAFSKIADGLGILAISLPVTQIASTITTYESRIHPGFLTASKIINGYVALAFAFAAFWTISKGVSWLVGTVKGTVNRTYYDVFMLLLIIISAVYSYLVFTNSARTTSALYALPDWLLILTIIIPYLYIWYIGFASALRLHYFQSQVRGILYKKSLRFLTLGLLSVLATSIILQFLAAVSNSLIDLGLKAILALLYVLLVIFSVGYILIAYGANKLTKIEEV